MAMKLAKIVKQCRIDKPERFKLADFDPAETFGLWTDIQDVRPILADGVARLAEMQERLYAHARWGALIVLQGMDAAGKDSLIKHVMTGINPLGCEVHAFKAPSAEELSHNFLWRIGRRLPERGRIGIFNRSHYEEVLVVRVHPKLLEREKLPPSVTKKNIWKRRFHDIRAFEHHLTRNGARWCSNFIYEFRKPNNANAFWRDSTSRQNTGNFPPTISPSVHTGTTTWRPMRT